MEKVIATIISCVSATILRPLFYPFLENDKVTSLRLNKGNFDAPAKISLEGKQGVECWFERTTALSSSDLEYFCDLSSFS